ncbi:unnamed protein product [Adineta steineri]|uniref:Uncharacterized protein n=1 Tax=Adineta steineri TaxID=433720 RepID=A0A814LB68_9BILA|nr:unnamed protein product [Adineta steineri]CAF3926016.1 unnamed protein product [Adineta steineri]
MALQLTLSCDSDKIESGPTLIHSTGIENYKIPPEVIRILQDTLTNELLSDHDEGVLCQDGSQRILDILLQHGFVLENQTTEDDKTVWTLVQNGDGNDSEHPVQPPNPDATADNENEGDAADGEQGGGDEEGENKPAADEEESGEAEAEAEGEGEE